MPTLLQELLEIINEADSGKKKKPKVTKTTAQRVYHRDYLRTKNKPYRKYHKDNKNSGE